MGMIQISGLTARQVEMCENLWNLDNHEDIQQYLSTLTHKGKIEAQAMMLLLSAEYIDSLDLGDCDQAREVITRVQDRLKPR